mmetsp:Transcript_49641/g.73973  ORF Transcript_49641/g.73973 Transcript_49641/m.73973 type:complete len:187 (+) Transcript_49641:434-994(+)
MRPTCRIHTCENVSSHTYPFLNKSGLRPDDDNPEQFWNCAEVSIDPGVPPPTPTTPTPTAAPVATSTPSGGTTNNGIPLPCCGGAGDGCFLSLSGYCSEDSFNCEEHCGGQWYSDSDSDSDTPTPTPAPVVTSDDGCCTWRGESMCPSAEDPSDACQRNEASCTSTSCLGSWINARRRNLRGEAEN